MPVLSPKLIAPQVLLISLLMFAFLLAGCSQGFNLDVNFDGGGDAGNVDNGTLFIVLVVVLIAVPAIVVVGRR